MAVHPKNKDIVDKKKDMLPSFRVHTLPFCIDLNIGPRIQHSFCCNLKDADSLQHTLQDTFAFAIAQ